MTNKQPGILDYIACLLFFLYLFALLSIVMYSSRVCGLIVGAFVFVVMAMNSFVRCLECRQEMKMGGTSLPWWKGWNILFVLGFVMGIAGYFVNWFMGFDFRTVWVFLVGLALVSFPFFWPIERSRADDHLEEIATLAALDLDDFFKALSSTLYILRERTRHEKLLR